MNDKAGSHAGDLLKRANAESTSGKSNALEQLIKEFFPIVNAVLWTRFGELLSPEERETYFLDVLRAYIAKPALYDPARPFPALLCAAASNNAAKEFRRRRSHNFMDQALLEETIPVTDHELTRIDDRDTLDLAARGLDPEDRCILFASKDQRDWAIAVGEQLGLSPNAVSKRWERIRKRVKESLSRSGDSSC